MSQKKDILRDFYKTLSGKGEEALRPPNDPAYVERFAQSPQKDPILLLAKRINWAESESVNLLTGYRGNGKSTELNRLKSVLEKEGCKVILVNLLEYIHLTKPVEISDFILSVMSALAVTLEEESGLKTITESYSKRLGNFLQSDVKISGVDLGVKGVAKLAFQLKEEPLFKEQLQASLRGHVTSLVRDAREYVVNVVQQIRKAEKDPDKKVVLLIDSVEQIRGVGQDAEEVHNSIVNLFSHHSSSLEFNQLHIVYTVPPYLRPKAPGVAKSLGNHPITDWPNIHVRKRETGAPDEQGLEIMRSIITKRFPDWELILTEGQLAGLAQSSGGDLRDFFRLVRESLIIKSNISTGDDDVKVSDEIIKQTESQLRAEHLPIMKVDAVWLAKVYKNKDIQLESDAELQRLARFFDGNLIMNYLNGEAWYDIHPLLVDEIKKH